MQQENNGQMVQLMETRKHRKTMDKSLSDPHVQLTTSNVNQSQISLQINKETSALCNLLQKQIEKSTQIIQQKTAHTTTTGSSNI